MTIIVLVLCHYLHLGMLCIKWYSPSVVGQSCEVLIHVDNQQLQLLPGRNGRSPQILNVLCWCK